MEADFNRELVRALLDQGGYTQNDFALAIGLDPTQLSKHLTGRVRQPSLSNLLKMAEFLGVPLEWLVKPPGEWELGEQPTPYNVERDIEVIEYANTDDPPDPIPDDLLHSGLGPYGSIRRTAADPDVYGIIVCGDDLEPAMPHGTRVLASPAAGFRPGRLHFVKAAAGRRIVRRVIRIDGSYLLTTFGPGEPILLAEEDIKSIHMIIAADFPR